MRRRVVLLWFIALAGLCAAGPQAVGAQEDEEWIGKKAPDFSMPDTEGKTVQLADFLGKKVVWLNFWGLRCGPCVRELPALQKIYEKYSPKGLVIIGINTDGVDGAFIKNQFAARDDLKKAKVTFPLTSDLDFKAIDAYALMGAPLNVMIDKQGKIQFRHEGYEDGDEAGYVKVLEKILAQ